MPDRIRIYHPETFEPFDLPVDKANDLRLNHGWTTSRPNTTAEPAVKTVEPESGIGTSPDAQSDEGESWRDSEVGQEVVEAAPQPRRSRRKPTVAFPE